jgi:hypothetical protein
MKRNVQASIAAATAAIGVIATRAAAPYLFALPILFLVWTGQAFPQGAANAPAPAAPTTSPGAELLKNWSSGMARVSPPQAGCFTSSYPSTQWQEIPCEEGPLAAPPSAPPSDVYGGPAAKAMTGSNISTAFGSFDSVSVSTVTPYNYTLQLNTNTFTTPACAAAPRSDCMGWQQFIYDQRNCGRTGTEPCTYIQYWLLYYGRPCPSGWNASSGSCWKNSPHMITPVQTVADLGGLSLMGQAGSGGDAVIFTSGSNLYMVQVASVLGLDQAWHAFSYNIVGEGDGSEVKFNDGASFVVRLSMDDGSTSAPSCDGSFTGGTAEHNNLYLQPASGTPRSSTQPALVYTESSNPTTTTSCDAASLVAAASKLTDTHDFNGDGFSDIVWSGTGGAIAVWLMNGAQVMLSGTAGTSPSTWSIVGQRDFNGDGTSDLLWLDTSGDLSIWFMIGTQVFSSAAVGNVGTTWSVVGTADFNNDGMGDILWRDSSGDTAVWLMNGASVIFSGSLGNIPTNYSVAGTGDFNGDGYADILWTDGSGNYSIWFMTGTAGSSPSTSVLSTALVGNIPTTWSVVGTGDFNGDHMTDIAWRDTAGDTAIWLMNGASVLSTGSLGNIPTNWSIALVGDYNGDGMSDLLWQDNVGDAAMWFMNGTAVSSTASLGNIPTTWTIQSANAE